MSCVGHIDHDGRLALGLGRVVVVLLDDHGVAGSAGVVAAAATADAKDDPGPDVAHEDNVGGGFGGVNVAAARGEVVTNFAAIAVAVGAAAAASRGTGVARRARQVAAAVAQEADVRTTWATHAL